MLEPPTAPQEASPASVATAHAARSAFRKHGNVRDVVRESSCRGAGFPVVTFELAAPPPAFLDWTDARSPSVWTIGGLRHPAAAGKVSLSSRTAQ
jgi:hypothetical protein